MKKILLVFPLLMLAVSCGPAPTPLATPQTLPNNLTGEWIVKMTQSGGLMGLSRSIVINSSGKARLEMTSENTPPLEKQLSPEQVQTLKDLIPSPQGYSPPRPETTCADCFVYDIQITSNGRVFTTQLNDASLPDSGMEELVIYLMELMNEETSGN